MEVKKDGERKRDQYLNKQEVDPQIAKTVQT